MLTGLVWCGVVAGEGRVCEKLSVPRITGKNVPSDQNVLEGTLLGETKRIHT